MSRRIGGGAVIAVGIIWIVATFALNLFGKTAAADRLTGDLRPAFSDSAIQQQQKDAATVAAFTDQIETKTVPLVASVLKTDNASVLKVLNGFPAVKRVLSTTDNNGHPFADGKPYLNHASEYVTTVANALAANQENYRGADAIPASWLPERATAALFLVLGIVSVLIGWRIWSTPEGGTWPAVVPVAIVGLVCVFAPLFLGLPGKTAKLDSLTNNFAPVFTTSGPLSIAEGQEYLKNVRAADVALETQVLPALPGLLHLPPAALASALKSNSPTVYAGLLTKDRANHKVSVVGGILDRWDGLAATVNSGIGDFNSTNAIPGLGLAAKVVPWLLIGPGLILLVAAWLVLVPRVIEPKLVPATA